MSNNYITQYHRQFELQFEAVRTSSQQRAWALRTPGWAAQQNEKEVLLSSEELVVNMLLSVQSPTHLSHTTHSNKEWEVYFSKVCSFIIIVDYVSSCICIRIVVSRLCNIVCYFNYSQMIIIIGNGPRFLCSTWTRLFAFPIVLIPLVKVCIQLFFLLLWVNIR